MRQYIIILDERGARVTSFVLGVHAETLEELHEYALQRYPGLTLLEADENLQNKLLDSRSRYIDGEVIQEPPKEPNKTTLIADLKASIDNKAATVKTKWSRFLDEYKEREKEAIRFKEGNYEGTPTEILKAFADAAQLDYKTATDIVLSQAERVRGVLTEIANTRMRKFSLKDDMSIEELQNIHDSIIEHLENIKE